HTCCDAPGFKIQLRDSLGALFSCYNLEASAGTPSCSNVTFSNTGSMSWLNWEGRYLQFGGYTGMATLEIIANDCGSGSHYGPLFFDASKPVLPIGTVTCFPISLQPY